MMRGQCIADNAAEIGNLLVHLFPSLLDHLLGERVVLVAFLQALHELAGPGPHLERLGHFKRRLDAAAALVDQELGKIAGLGSHLGLHADDRDRARHDLSIAEAEVEDSGRLHRRRQRGHLIAGDLIYPRDHLVGVVKAVERI